MKNSNFGVYLFVLGKGEMDFLVRKYKHKQYQVEIKRNPDAFKHFRNRKTRTYCI